VGQRCRQATIKDIFVELSVDWNTMKTLEKYYKYMHGQLARAELLSCRRAFSRKTYHSCSADYY